MPVAASVVVPAGCVVRDEAPHIQAHIDAGLVDQGRPAVVSLSCRSQKQPLVQAIVNTIRQEHKQAKMPRE